MLKNGSMIHKGAGPTSHPSSCSKHMHFVLRLRGFDFEFCDVQDRQIESLRTSFTVVKDEASNIPMLRQHVAALQKEAAGGCSTSHTSHTSNVTRHAERESFISALLTQRSDADAQVQDS